MKRISPSFLVFLAFMVGCTAMPSLVSSPTPGIAASSTAGTVAPSNTEIPTDAGVTSTQTVTGTVMDVMLSAQVILLKEPVQGISTVALTQETRLAFESGGVATLKDITPGMLLEASGEIGSAGTLIASQVVLLER